MPEPSLQNEPTSAVGSPADAGEGSAGRERIADVIDRFREHAITTPLEIAGFWLAVGLPFLYVPLLLTGVSSDGEIVTFLGLLALHVAALLAGHDYKRD